VDINESYTQLITEDIEFKRKCMAFLAPFVDKHQFNQRFRRGFWDGRKHLYTIENKNVQFPKGLVEYIIKELEDSKLEFEY